MATVFEELRTLVEGLPPYYQQQVLEFAQGLAKTQQVTEALPITSLPPGTPGSALLRFKLPLEDAEAMEHALEDGK